MKEAALDPDRKWDDIVNKDLGRIVFDDGEAEIELEWPKIEETTLEPHLVIPNKKVA